MGVWSCISSFRVFYGTALGVRHQGHLPVVIFVSRVARSDSGCSISPSTSHHIPQTCDPAIVRDRQGLSCRSASGSSGLTASFGCQLPRRHSLPVGFAQRSILSSLLSNRVGQLQLSDLLSGVRELSGAVRSCPVLACGGWAAGRGLGCWSGVSAGNDEWTKVAER